MEIKIKPLQKREFNKAIAFAIKGMNFNRYVNNPLLLYLYARYFWYMELLRASQVIAAYQGNRLVGVLLCNMKGESKRYYSVCKNVYVKLIDFVQRILFRNGVNAYDKANAVMYKSFEKKYKADGEINFLAADSDAKIKGVGTLLLQELERRETGKRIYLYTDNNCTYQFYEHRGFERICEKQILLDISGNKKVPLSCYLYSKVCGNER